MNTSNSYSLQKESNRQETPSQNGEPVQISLPQSDEMQTGPFEHSGETSRQTEEARKEEAEKEEQA